MTEKMDKQPKTRRIKVEHTLMLPVRFEETIDVPVNATDLEIDAWLEEQTDGREVDCEQLNLITTESGAVRLRSQGDHWVGRPCEMSDSPADLTMPSLAQSGRLIPMELLVRDTDSDLLATLEINAAPYLESMTPHEIGDLVILGSDEVVVTDKEVLMLIPDADERLDSGSLAEVTPLFEHPAFLSFAARHQEDVEDNHVPEISEAGLSVELSADELAAFLLSTGQWGELEAEPREKMLSMMSSGKRDDVESALSGGSLMEVAPQNTVAGNQPAL